MESLQVIKANFVENVEVIRATLGKLKLQLNNARTIEEHFQIMQKIRALKMSICFD
jgi:hypothetical protein